MKAYYDEGGISIFHGRAEVVLPHIGSADLLATDPPYGIGEARKNNPSRGVLAVARDFGRDGWDDQPPPRWLLDQSISMTRHQVIFGGNFFGLPPSSCWLVWDKDNGENDFADCELAWTNLPKAVRRLRFRWQGMLQEYGGKDKEPRFHPTQKPLAVMTWAIQQAPDDCAVILDPFMGSGTTLRAAMEAGERHRVFCASLADVGEGRDTMPADSWHAVQVARIRLQHTIMQTPHLDWLLLTKRPENMPDLYPREVLERCWVGTSVEDQPCAEKRIPELLKCPAAFHFLSCEPLLGPIDLTRFAAHPMVPRAIPLDWVIVGGESGPEARPMHPEWVRTLRDQCVAGCVAFFFKQWGENTCASIHAGRDYAHVCCVTPNGKTTAWSLRKDDGWWRLDDDCWRNVKTIPEDAMQIVRVGKKAAGRTLDGREWSEFPTAVGAVVGGGACR